MIVCMCCTRNWYIYLPTVIYALFKNNDVKKLYLFIEDNQISYLKDKRIQFINVNDLPEYITKQSPNYNTQYSKLSYLRCYFSKVLDEDKILYLDVDTLVVDNIQELWNADLQDNVLIAVHEPGEWNNHLWTYGLDDTYINSGVLIMDLKKIRDEKLDDSMIYLLNHNYYRFPDQDVINLVCRNRIKYVDNRYNSSETTGFRDDAKILHYIRGNKGWIQQSPRSDVWYNYHNQYIKEEKNMDIYKVKALKGFNDYEGRDVNGGGSFKERQLGEEFDCTAERYLYLKEHNAVELVEIIPVVKKIEAPEIKLEIVDEEVKPKKKKNKKK